MKTVMLHMKLPDDLAEAAAGKDLKVEVSSALRARWFGVDVGIFNPEHPAMADEVLNVGDSLYPTYGSIPAEQKQ